MRGKSRLLQTIIQLINTSTKLIDANEKKNSTNILTPFLPNHSSPLLLISKKRQNTDPLTRHGFSL